MRRLALLLFSFLQAGGQPINIPIQNPDFTQGETGWQFSAGSGLDQLNGIPTAGAGYGSSFQQTIQVAQMPVGIYTLTFDIGNYYYWYPGEPTVSISLSNAYESPWCSVSAHPLGDFTHMTLLCTVRDMYAQSLTILLYDKGWPSESTHFALTFTPTN